MSNNIPFNTTDRLLTLADLAGDSAGSFNKADVAAKIETLPLAQFKHLPDPSVLGSFTSITRGGRSKKSLKGSKIITRKSKSLKN